MKRLLVCVFLAFLISVGECKRHARSASAAAGASTGAPSDAARNGAKAAARSLKVPDLTPPVYSEEIREPKKGDRSAPRIPPPLLDWCHVETTTEDEKDEIVKVHNDLRRKVAMGEELMGYAGEPQPRAKNMMEMGYNNKLEKMAKDWARMCNFNEVLNYDIGNFTSVWQIVLYQSSDRPIKRFDLAYAALYRYYTTVSNFYGPDAIQPFYGYNSLTKKDVRQYAVMVNHDARAVGCAQATYYEETEMKYHRVAICNYANGFQMGESLYDSGEPCKDVANNYCDDGLITIS